MNGPRLTPNRDSQFIGFDYGLRRIGVAVGESVTGSASPRPTVVCNGEPNWPALEQEIKRWKPLACVVGLPLNLDGSPQAMTRYARHFAGELKRRYRLPVYLCDERFSSREADTEIRLARADGRKLRKVRKGERDSVAARLILEQWMKTHWRTQLQDPKKTVPGKDRCFAPGKKVLQATDRDGNTL